MRNGDRYIAVATPIVIEKVVKYGKLCSVRHEIFDVEEVQVFCLLVGVRGGWMAENGTVLKGVGVLSW